MTRIDVHLDEAGDGPVLAGVATVRRTRGVETTEFTYDGGFLAGRAWQISPDLPIHRARTALEGLPGALDDSAPDTWGRNLITRRLAAQARDAGHVAPTPTEVADHGSAVDEDLVELWRRIAFSVAINNTDDHLRNHGFLHASGGWTLSPVFDVNPELSHDAARATALAGATRAEECRDALIATAASFGLESWQAEQSWEEVVDATATWRSVAGGYGIVGSEIEAFAPAMDRWRTG